MSKDFEVTLLFLRSNPVFDYLSLLLSIDTQLSLKKLSYFEPAVRAAEDCFSAQILRGALDSMYLFTHILLF